MARMKGLLYHFTVSDCRMLLLVVALQAAVASSASSEGCVEAQACRRSGLHCDCAGGSGGGATESLCFSSGLDFCTSLRVDGRLVGSASETSFAAVPRLDSLSMRDCGLRRVDAGALALLPRLLSLDLAGNPLDGDRDLAFLRNATQLLHLTLSYCNISDVPVGAFKPLTALESLALAGNELTSVPPELFESLPTLRRLDLSHNKLFNFHLSASSLPSLTILNLSYNSLKDVQLFTGGVPGEFRGQLECLDLSHNVIGDNLAFLRDISQLKDLNLSSCDVVHVSDEHMSFVSNLRRLDLGSNFISDLGGLKVLGELLKLIVRNNKISQIPESIIPPNVRSLNVANNNITNVTFLKSLKSLLWLDISSNPINLIPNDAFVNTKAMETFVAAHTNISDAVFLNNVSEDLTYLNISFGNLSYINVDNIKHLVHLKTLDIAFNKLSNVDFLRELTSLENVNAQNNSIASMYPTTFRPLRKLKKLWLSNNRMEDAQFMYHLNNLTKLKVRNNKLKSIPTFSDKLLLFETADLSQNGLENMEFVRSSPSLRVLNLDDNSVAAVPKGLLLQSDLESISLAGNPLQDIAFVCESHLKSVQVSGGAMYSADKRRMIQSEAIHFESDKGSLMWETLTKCNFVNPEKSTIRDLSVLCRCVSPAVAFEVLLWAGVAVAALLVAALLCVVLRARGRRRRRSPSEEDPCVVPDREI